jgi:hypothetical protein
MREINAVKAGGGDEFAENVEIEPAEATFGSMVENWANKTGTLCLLIGCENDDDDDAAAAAGGSHTHTHSESRRVNSGGLLPAFSLHGRPKTTLTVWQFKFSHRKKGTAALLLGLRAARPRLFVWSSRRHTNVGTSTQLIHVSLCVQSFAHTRLARIWRIQKEAGGHMPEGPHATRHAGQWPCRTSLFDRKSRGSFVTSCMSKIQRQPTAHPYEI